MNLKEVKKCAPSLYKYFIRNKCIFLLYTACICVNLLCYVCMYNIRTENERETIYVVLAEFAFLYFGSFYCISINVCNKIFLLFIC